MFEKKRRTSSHSTMAHRASRGGIPLLILKLAEEYNRSPAICPVTFWTATTHAGVRSTVSSLYKLVLSIPVSASFWAAVGCVLKVRVTFRFFVVFLVVFFLNILFPNTDFLEPCLRTRQYNTRNPNPKMGLPWWCDMMEKSGSLRTEKTSLSHPAPYTQMVCFQGNMLLWPLVGLSITLATSSSSNHLS